MSNTDMYIYFSKSETAYMDWIEGSVGSAKANAGLGEVSGVTGKYGLTLIDILRVR